MVSCFVASLKEEIQLGIQMFRPTSMIVVTSLGRLEEKKKNMASRRTYKSDNSRPGVINSAGINRSNLPMIKKLSPSKMKEHRDKVLCYSCDEKFSPGHRCKI